MIRPLEAWTCSNVHNAKMLFCFLYMLRIIFEQTELELVGCALDRKSHWKIVSIIPFFGSMLFCNWECKPTTMNNKATNMCKYLQEKRHWNPHIKTWLNGTENHSMHSVSWIKECINSVYYLSVLFAGSETW